MTLITAANLNMPPPILSVLFACCANSDIATLLSESRSLYKGARQHDDGDECTEEVEPV